MQVSPTITTCIQNLSRLNEGRIVLGTLFIPHTTTESNTSNRQVFADIGKKKYGEHLLHKNDDTCLKKSVKNVNIISRPTMPFA